MSDIISEDSQCMGHSESESTLPHYSVVDSTIDLTSLGVNENTNLNHNRFSANQPKIEP